MYQSQFCYKHFTFSPILEAENITTSEKEVFPPELLKFAEQLSSAGKTVYDVFSEMDLNEDGTLDVSEFREGLAALDEFDRSGDGKISLGEFDALVRRIPGYVLQESSIFPRRCRQPTNHTLEHYLQQFRPAYPSPYNEWQLRILLHHQSCLRICLCIFPNTWTIEVWHQYLIVDLDSH